MPRFVTHAPPIPSASSPELEAQLRADPADERLGQVYADWLIERGDPRGELAMARLRGDTASEVALLEAHGGWRAGVDPQVVTIDWAIGRFRRIHLMNVVDWMDRSFDVGTVAERLFAQPAANCLEALAVGVLRWEYMSADLTRLLTDAAARPFAPGLRTLHLGDCGDIDIDNAHHEIGDLPDLSAFERLEHLQIWGYEIGLQPLRHPKLRRLALQTCALRAETLRVVLEGELPALEELELWFGSEDSGADAGADDLAPLLEGRVLPTVTRLGLRNAEFSNALVPALLASPVLARLEVLDLSMGTLEDSAVDQLLAAPERWRHLKRLDVDDNFLSAERVEALRAVGPTVEGDIQKDDEDDDYRYVSVAE